MSADLEVIYAKMSALRGPYLQQVKERVVILRRCAKALESNTLTAVDREELKFLAHKFAGTGAIYGYPAISETGRTLEHYMIAHPDNGADMLRLTETLIVACQQAMG